MAYKKGENMPRNKRPKHKYKRFVVTVKGRGFPVNPGEEHVWEGPARKSFKEWVEQGNKYQNVEYIQLWDLGDGVEDPVIIKERRW